MRSLMWPLGTWSRNASSPPGSGTTSWKVESHTASETWARSRAETAVHTVSCSAMAVSFRVGMGLAAKSTSYTHGYPQAVDGFRVFLVLFATFSVGNAP